MFCHLRFVSAYWSLYLMAVYLSLCLSPPRTTHKCCFLSLVSLSLHTHTYTHTEFTVKYGESPQHRWNFIAHDVYITLRRCCINVMWPAGQTALNNSCTSTNSEHCIPWKPEYASNKRKQQPRFYWVCSWIIMYPFYIPTRKRNLTPLNRIENANITHLFLRWIP